MLEFVKRVADPIHGTIPLTEAEVRVLSAPAFLRLQAIKHLGMAHLVYPGADFSRFSHCLGVCHVTGRILEALQSWLKLDKSAVQLYRLAALLHDVGHYPFSHLAERAAKNYYQTKSVIRRRPSEEVAEPSPSAYTVYSHERVGREVVEGDTDISDAIKAAGLTPRNVTALLMHENVGGASELPNLASIISSDLDADRIDYLLRMAHNTGLPYGTLDLDYLLSQMVCDAEGKASVTMKALRTVEHFLLQRLFAYQQIAYHKTVAAFELVLEQVLELLLAAGLINCSAEWVGESIRSGNWRSFTDGRVIERITELESRLTPGTVEHTKVWSILRRRPAKMIFETQFFGDRRDESEFIKEKQAAAVVVEQLATEFSIPRALFYVWAPAPAALTKVGARVAMSLEAMPVEEIDQSIRMVSSPGSASAKIQELRRSILRPLSDLELYALRIYVLFQADLSADRIRGLVEEMRARVPMLNPLLNWE